LANVPAFLRLKFRAIRVRWTSTRRPAHTPLALSAVVCTGAATIFLLSGLVLRDLQLDVQPQGWGAIIGIALATAVPLAAFYRGIAAVDPSAASILLTVEPAFTVVLAALVLGERLGGLQLLGGGFVLSAVVLLQFGHRESWPSATTT
jgi:drug/metabolite transporter (DMT)-like permease